MVSDTMKFPSLQVRKQVVQAWLAWSRIYGDRYRPQRISKDFFLALGRAQGDRLWFAISKRPTSVIKTGRVHANPAPFLLENALNKSSMGLSVLRKRCTFDLKPAPRQKGCLSTGTKLLPMNMRPFSHLEISNIFLVLHADIFRA